MKIHAVSQTLIPAATADGTFRDVRLDGFGAQHVRNEPIAWAEEGAYFRTGNPTLGTGIAQTIQTTFSATNAVFALRNDSATKKIIPHYLRLINTAAGATTTSSRMAVVIDPNSRALSGGTDAAPQIACANSGLGPASSISQMRFGAVTVGAAVAPRTMANLQLKTQAAPCWTVGDEVRVFFGDDADSGQLNGAAAVCIVKNVGPVILGGQNHTLSFHLWNPANATTAPSWEFEFAWWER